MAISMKTILAFVALTHFNTVMAQDFDPMMTQKAVDPTERRSSGLCTDTC